MLDKFSGPGVKSRRQVFKSPLQLQNPALHKQEKPVAVSRSAGVHYSIDFPRTKLFFLARHCHHPAASDPLSIKCTKQQKGKFYL